MQEHNNYRQSDEIESKSIETDPVLEHIKSNTEQLDFAVQHAIKEYQPEVDVVQFSNEVANINLLINQLLTKYYELESTYHLAGLVVQRGETTTQSLDKELKKQSDILSDYYARLIMPLKSQLIALERTA